MLKFTRLMSIVKFNDSAKFRDIYNKQNTVLDPEDMEDANMNKMYPFFHIFNMSSDNKAKYN